MEPGETRNTVTEQPEWSWSVVANVRETLLVEQDGELNVVHGAKRFTPGSKLYILPSPHCDFWDSYIVLGRKRRTNTLVRTILNVRYLENFRVTRTYDKHALRLFAEELASPCPQRHPRSDTSWDTSDESKERADRLCEHLAHRSAELRQVEVRKAQLYGVNLDDTGRKEPDAYAPPLHGRICSAAEANAAFGPALAAFAGATLEGVFALWDAGRSAWNHNAEVVLVMDRGHIALSSGSYGGILLRFCTIDLARPLCLRDPLQGDDPIPGRWRRHGASALAQNRRIAGFAWRGFDEERVFALDVNLEDAGTLVVGTDRGSTEPGMLLKSELGYLPCFPVRYA
jgi:hypothetical protein